MPDQYAYYIGFEGIDNVIEYHDEESFETDTQILAMHSGCIFKYRLSDTHNSIITLKNVFSPVHVYAICQITDENDPNEICSDDNPCSAHSYNDSEVYLTCNPGYANIITERLKARTTLSTSNMLERRAYDEEKSTFYDVLVSMKVYEVGEIYHQAGSELGQMAISNMYAWSKVISPSPIIGHELFSLKN